jgi:DnaD/phage-associated family protein
MSTDFRSVQTRMWREDDWFQSLPTDARLLFIYLFTNPSASVAGIYRLPLRTIEFESGIPASRVQELLTQFATDNKAYYGDGVLWVVRMRENQLPTKGTLSKPLEIHIRSEIAKIPDGRIKTMYLEHYGYPIDDKNKGSHRVSIPYGGTDTNTETTTETNTDTETITPVVVVVTEPPVAESGAVFAAWQDNMPGTLTPIIADDLKDLIDTYGADNVIRAITESARSGVRTMRYMSGILRNWASGTPKQERGTTPATVPRQPNGKVSKVAMSMAACDEVEEMLKKGGVT